MANPIKLLFVQELTKRFGAPRKLLKSESLFQLAETEERIYFRYSKKHRKNQTFFGLRKIDLHALEGHAGILCFCWEGQVEPLFVPFIEFEEVFARLAPANDGQYKVQIYETESGIEMNIVNAGRFNVESYQGWSYLESLIATSKARVPSLSHAQVQTILGSIGSFKGFDIWIPPIDRAKLDWSLTPTFPLSKQLPSILEPIIDIAGEIDVIWVDRGANRPVALYEVEHTTPIYSGLLRFNDIHLVIPQETIRFGIVSNDERRALFVRQLMRPTFKASGLKEVCTFFDYPNVFGWHRRIISGG
ncbi:MAG: hypothetical protein SCK70_12285 [bacterium]|nr:hypothetical protein [bacterium]